MGGAPLPFDAEIFDLGIPTLGICLGFQMWADHIRARVVAGEKREFGVHVLQLVGSDPLFDGVTHVQVLQSHGDKIETHPNITVLGTTDNAPIAAGRYKHLWGVQFHPEVTETVDGAKMLENFCVTICGITDRFPAQNVRSEEHTSELQSRSDLVCRLLL